MSSNITFTSGNVRKNLNFEGRRAAHDLLIELTSDSDSNGLKFDFPCGGKKTCGKCRIKITDGFEFVSEPDETEKKFLSEKEIGEHIRYACMCEIFGSVTIELIAAETEKMQVQTAGMESKYATANQSQKAAPGKTARVYGAAVDIGTTTVAVYLYDMITGDCLGIATEENPQRAYGADVITRINYTIENTDGLDNLKNLILSLVFKLIKNLCGENNINPCDVYSIVLTGNTVMQHIAFGYPPKTIAFAPFTPVSLFGFEAAAKEVGISGVNESAVIYFPPAFASYVGGDVAAGIIASDSDLCENLRLFLDVGTNGEIGLGNKDGFILCATAMGPAFEGAHIKLGMPGIKGAVNKIYLDEANNIICETIGNIAPKGICGSGIIDAVALMLELGVADETGRILDSGEGDEIPEKHRSFTANLCEIDGENVFMIDKTHNIYMTQKDVREIMLAKAAVCAGIMTLLHYAEKSVGDIGELILAGGFGAHIDKKSACRIGLIPQELEDKIIVAGNTAGTGAAAVLLDSFAVERINKIAGISKYIELSGDPFFRDEYIERMMF